MYIDINTIIKVELRTMMKICSTIESAIRENKDRARSNGKRLKGTEGQLYDRNTSEGIIYHFREYENGRRVSHKLGKADNADVIRIKQDTFNREMVRRLKKDIELLSGIENKFLPYDPEAIDEELHDVYKDHTGLVNKAPGILDLTEWNKIIKKNSYKMPDNCNIAPDGMETRSKSEIIVYGILRGYGLVIKYDMEIELIDDTGQIVAVCPDFVILCNDGSLIIVEHLGMLDKDDYLKNALRRIHLYLINGYILNKNLFLTADYAKGKIDAQAIDELVRKMILPRVNGTMPAARRKTCAENDSAEGEMKTGWQ